MDINIKTTKVFKLINQSIQEGKTIISMQGSSRSGKTYNIVLWLIIYAVTHPNTTISIVRKTLPSVKQTVFRDFREIMINLKLFNDKSLNKTDLIYHFDNGSFVEFFSVDNEQKIRGAKRQILFINEANELAQIQWLQLMMRTTQLKIIDYNPSFSDDHWIVNEVNKDLRTAYYITTYKDNPFLEKEVVANIESLKNKNPNLWRIYGQGLQAIIEGLIFKNVEIIKELPIRNYKVFRGIDFGYTNDPTAIVRVSISGDELYLEEIAYNTHLLTTDIIRILKQEQGKVISESADPRLVDEIYRAGINIHAVKKYQGSVQAGIMKMQEYKIFITENSLNLIKEFKNYVYQKDKEGKTLNVPIDAFNHAIDAVRYVILEEVIASNRRPINFNKLANSIY